MSSSHSLLTALERVARPRHLIAFGLGWAALAALLFLSHDRFSLAAVEAACDEPPPDVHFAPSPVAVRGFIQACGKGGLASYRDLQVVDLVYPATGALLLIGLLAFVLPHAGIGSLRARWLLVVPALAALADYVENAVAWSLIVSGSVSDGLARVLQASSAVKGIASWGSWLAVIVLVVVAMLRRAGDGTTLRAARSRAT